MTTPTMRCSVELVRPDAHDARKDDGWRVECFLEREAASEPLSRVASKLDGYRDLAEADDLLRPVFFWLAQPGREPGLRRAMRAAAVPVATAIAVTGDPADAVWLPVGEEAPRRRLTQLGTVAARATR